MAVQFKDCRGQELAVGDLVTLAGYKSRSVVTKTVRRGYKAGLVAISPPRPYIWHKPEELERVNNPDRRGAAGPGAQVPGERGDTGAATPEGDARRAFRAWLGATGRTMAQARSEIGPALQSPGGTVPPRGAGA